MSRKEKSLKKFATLEFQSKETWSKLSKIDISALEKMEAENKWNTLQHLEHLRMSEYLALRYVKYKISQGTKFKRATLKTNFKSYLLTRVFESPKKRKAPDVNGLVPQSEGLNLAEILKKWQTQRAELRQFLDAQPEHMFTKEVYKHPGIGRLSLSHMMSFFINHSRRHYRHIDRILNPI